MHKDKSRRGNVKVLRGVAQANVQTMFYPFVPDLYGQGTSPNLEHKTGLIKFTINAYKNPHRSYFPSFPSLPILQLIGEL